ncbi:NusB antitermination factor [Paucidesulfovibrio gracilis DSM 16080]|uniref:Transcription antitermination protein NusB n=1 Tax=Paucidesulfovibrio gracilis DSM 16080 TaxID=1121449 RepID=A0A1T4X1M1_9BACT|nr:transcription antitermination factor NusB [Paucidesulfovibrio gracilis]SKA83337.1 NusB antitermination factor [Paucidesulfovibrio gracilis DSM 16080]
MMDDFKAPRKGAGNRRKSNRRTGRMLAFQVLFAQSFTASEDVSALERDFAENPAVLAVENESVSEFAHDLVLGVYCRARQLDEIVNRYSKHWKLERIAKVELTILRLALFEMLFTELPLKVAINEAIELSKEFGDGNSRNFINGILDAAARAVESGDLGQHKTF